MSTVLCLLYRGRAFEAHSDGRFQVSLLLTREQKVELGNLIESEEEDWYLDENGERLPAEVLFQKSPWSVATGGGQYQKILCRFLNLETGEAMFSVPSMYGGEFHDWLRSQRAGA
jgi:hypothetical protein